MPIPQDTARMEKRRRDWLEWNRQTLSGAYDKVGKKNPKWDKFAHEAMEHAARMFSLQLDPPVRMGQIYHPAKAAVDVGCDDPLVVYLLNRSAQGTNYPGHDEIIRRMKDSGKALAGESVPRHPSCDRSRSGRYPHAVRQEPERRDQERGRGVLRRVAGAPARKRQECRAQRVLERERWFSTINDLVRGYRTIGVEAPRRIQAGR